MANLTLGGYRPWGTLTGGRGVYPHPMVSELANNYGTAVGRGDLIIPVSDGTVAVAAAADNGKLMGVVVGTSRVISGKRTPCPLIPANTTFTPTTVGSVNASLVEWIPLTGDLIMEVDADDGTTATTLATQIALIGENCDMTVGTPDATTGVSGYSLDISTHVTTTCNFRIIGIGGYTLQSGLNLTGGAGGVNDPTASRFKFLVTCNEGFLPPYTATGL